MLIFETENFTVETVENPPHITRTEGGHIVIVPKVRVSDRTQLSPALAVELQRLTVIVGEAMTTALNQRGIDIGRINYQDNGNWGVFAPEGSHLHIHLYGRAKSATLQKYGEALHLPRPRSTDFYATFEPLNAEDIKAIRSEIETLFKEEKHQDKHWHL